MNTYVALFRGINVGGKRVIRMKDLVNLLSELGFKNIKTYIQSGNAIFSSNEPDASKISAEIAAAVHTAYGFKPAVHVMRKKEFLKAVENNPFSEYRAEPKSLHLGFLSEIPEHPDSEGLEAARKDTEQFQIIGKVFYLYAPEGIGRSMLSSKSERLLGVASMTDRNWSTVLKLEQMLNELEA